MNVNTTCDSNPLYNPAQLCPRVCRWVASSFPAGVPLRTTQPTGLAPYGQRTPATQGISSNRVCTSVHLPPRDPSLLSRPHLLQSLSWCVPPGVQPPRPSLTSATWPQQLAASSSLIEHSLEPWLCWAGSLPPAPTLGSTRLQTAANLGAPEP